MPFPLRNGDILSPAVVAARHEQFHSAVSERKLRRLNALILVLRFAAFSFCLAAAVFMAADSVRSRGRGSTSASWHDYVAFRFVLAANAIVAVYSLFEMGAAVCEILRGTTLLPESLQLWFDFSHDQVFGYMLLAAMAAGVWEARQLRRACGKVGESAFCMQADIAVALGFAGFAFVALSALFSGYRLVCFTITGSRFHL